MESPECQSPVTSFSNLNFRIRQIGSSLAWQSETKQLVLWSLTGQEFGIHFGIIILRDIINRYICAESADQSILLDVCTSIWKVPHGIRANKGADQLRHRVELNSSTERSGEPNKPSEPANLTHSSFEHLRWLTHSHSGTAFAIPFTCCHMSILNFVNKKNKKMRNTSK